MADTVEVRGISEVQKKLYAYSRRFGDKVMLMALKEGAKVVQKALKTSGIVPKKTGKLRRGFRIVRSKIHNGRNGTPIVIYLTLKKGKEAPYYGRFVNDGWNSHGKLNAKRLRFGKKGFGFTRTSMGSSRTTSIGRNIKGKHFVESVYEMNKSHASQVVIKSASLAADQLAKRINF